MEFAEHSGGEPWYGKDESLLLASGRVSVYMCEGVAVVFGNNPVISSVSFPLFFGV